MTVQELIDELQECNPNHEVVTENDQSIEKVHENRCYHCVVLLLG